MVCSHETIKGFVFEKLNENQFKIVHSFSLYFEKIKYVRLPNYPNLPNNRVQGYSHLTCQRVVPNT